MSPEKTEQPKAQVKKNPAEDLAWKPYHQPEFIGLVNEKTGEAITNEEAIRRILCYAEEAAKNTR